MTEMREQMHGTLSEIVDEKEVIQTSAWVLIHMIISTIIFHLRIKEREEVCNTLLPQ